MATYNTDMETFRTLFERLAAIASGSPKKEAK